MIINPISLIDNSQCSLPTIHMLEEVENDFNTASSIFNVDPFREKLQQEANSIFSFLNKTRTPSAVNANEKSLISSESSALDQEFGIEKRFHPINKKRHYQKRTKKIDSAKESRIEDSSQIIQKGPHRVWNEQEMVSLCKIVVEVHKEVLQFKQSLKDNDTSQPTYRYIEAHKVAFGHRKKWDAIVKAMYASLDLSPRTTKAIKNQIQYSNWTSYEQMSQTKLKSHQVWSKVDKNLFEQFKEGLSSFRKD